MSDNKYLEIQKEIESYGFTLVDKDFDRPWGAFLVIDEQGAQDFANRFFDGIDVDNLRVEGKLSPKILIVKPDARLSWHDGKSTRTCLWRNPPGFSNKADVRFQKGHRHGFINLFTIRDQTKGTLAHVVFGSTSICQFCFGVDISPLALTLPTR